MQLGITCSFDVQEWWWNPPKTSPPLLNIFVCIPLLSSVWWRWHHLLGLCFHGASASVLALCGTLGAWQMLWREHCFVQVPHVFLSVLLLGCWLPASIVTLVRGPKMSPWRLQTPATNYCSDTVADSRLKIFAGQVISHGEQGGGCADDVACRTVCSIMNAMLKWKNKANRLLNCIYIYDIWLY